MTDPATLLRQAHDLVAEANAIARTQQERVEILTGIVLAQERRIRKLLRTHTPAPVFAMVWESSESVADVARRLETTPDAVRSRAVRLRDDGWTLKRLPSGGPEPRQRGDKVCACGTALGARNVTGKCDRCRKTDWQRAQRAREDNHAGS